MRRGMRYALHFGATMTEPVHIPGTARPIDHTIIAQLAGQHTIIIHRDERRRSKDLALL